MGRIVYFYLEAFDQSTEVTHSTGIKQIYIDVNGTQLCFVDEKCEAYIYDPISENILKIPDCPDSIEGIIWDQNMFERGIFAVYNQNFIFTYIYVKYYVEGIINYFSILDQILIF